MLFTLERLYRTLLQEPSRGWRIGGLMKSRKTAVALAMVTGLASFRSGRLRPRRTTEDVTARATASVFIQRRITTVVVGPGTDRATPALCT